MSNFQAKYSGDSFSTCRAFAIACMPVQVLVNLCAAGEPFCNLGVGRNAPVRVAKHNLARLVPVRR